MSRQNKTKKDNFKSRNRFFYCNAVFLVISIFIYICSRLSTTLADFFAEYTGGFIRFLLATITSIIPFSLAESLVFLFLPISVIVMFFAPDVEEGKHLTRNTLWLIGVLFLVLSLFLSAFAPCYFRTTVSEEMALDRNDVETEDVLEMANWVSLELEELATKINTDCNGKGLMPYSYSSLVSKLNRTYTTLCDDLEFLGDFYSRPKVLAISKLMPYTRISGVYSFFTGESNVSISYPDFMIPFTTAHEMAHQRGIAREDEANFIAFLVCLKSNDPFIRYSGLTEILRYLLDSVYITDTELYQKVYLSTPAIYKKESSNLADFLQSTSIKVVSGATNSINNALLQSQGQSEGSASYGLVTELAVAYYKGNIKKE